MYVNNEQETETIREEYLLHWKTGIIIIIFESTFYR